MIKRRLAVGLARLSASPGGKQSWFWVEETREKDTLSSRAGEVEHGELMADLGEVSD